MNGRILPLRTADTIRQRSVSAVDPATLVEASRILEDIGARGDDAVLTHARRLGDLGTGQRLIHDAADLAKALKRLPAEQQALLERGASRIRAFAIAQRDSVTSLSVPLPGGQAGHDWLPVRSAGCYAPGGRYPLPSSVLMTAVTARVAGVETVWVASPRPADVTLAAAAVAGAEGLLAIGGVQAVAALARGLVGVPACDMVVGPGNRWVTAAKLLLSAETGIDMLAGPSELLVLADGSANPAWVAADLMAQAEHDPDAVPMLVTTDADLAFAVEEQLGAILEDLVGSEPVKQAFANGFACVVEHIDAAVSLVDRIGPEHLEIHARDAGSIAQRIRNAGAVFVGELSAEVLGDYASGPNHVLPTGATSRYTAGLSVFSFLRPRTWLRIDDRIAVQPLLRDAAAFARLEGLAGHARSARCRLASGQPNGDTA